MALFVYLNYTAPAALPDSQLSPVSSIHLIILQHSLFNGNDCAKKQYRKFYNRKKGD